MVTLFFSMQWHMSKPPLSFPSGTMGYLSFITPSLSILNSPHLKILWHNCIPIYQASFTNRLHEQEFATLLMDVTSHAMWTCLQSCVGPTTSTWLLTYPTTPTFCLSLVHFLRVLHTHLGLPHSTNARLSHCQCEHTIDDLGIHIFQRLCKNECIATHNTLQDTIKTIVLDNGAHEKEVSHLFPHQTPHQVDIFITKCTFQILADIIIIHLTWLDMV